MKRISRRRIFQLVLLGLVIAALSGVLLTPRANFVLGGGLINLGYSLQDRHTAFDLEHGETISPAEVWEELEYQNDLASDMRDVFPRTPRHPVVAVLACMDGRIDMSELMGDTRHYYYVVRTAGSVLSPAEQEMLELSVLNGVKVILLTTHTDCAAEAAAADPVQRERFPALIELMDARVERVREFMARPVIRDALAEGRLRIEHARIDTATDRLIVDDEHHDAH